jgi:hypothetical protein
MLDAGGWDGEAVFVPDAVPRKGVLALWGTGSGPDKVHVVVPCPTWGVRKRLVSATLVPIAEALPVLLAVDPTDPETRRSVGVWAVAAVAGVGLIARGRLLPAVTAEGVDAWRVGPLDPADLAWLRELAAAFPLAAHAVPVAGSRPMRVRSPQALVRDFWDAIADTLVRTAAAPRAVGLRAFAAAEPTVVDELNPWLAPTAGELTAGASLGLRVEAVVPPAADDGDVLDDDDSDELAALTGAVDDTRAPSFRLVPQLRSTADPSLVVDAADLWDQPGHVLARFGTQTETDLLLALRRGAEIWPRLGELLRQARPSHLDLDDDAVGQLLGPVTEQLAGTGIEVLWPTSMVDDGLRLRAVPTPVPERLTEAGFGLDTLLQFRWQLTLDGAALDPDEISALAQAKRSIVRLRGRWLVLDPALLQRLRKPPRTRMTAREALAAVLAGSADIDGQAVDVVADGPLAQLAARVTALASAPPVLHTPDGLNGVLRPYQQRGLAWLAGMCDIGLGGCLADDMGLGKTIQVIALHLHRRAAAAGPTLVVCPASLLGTWQREVARFAADVPVRRFHGGGRHLNDVAGDEIVLTTYGVALRDTAALSDVHWGLVVADEAQHVKNPLSHTAGRLRELRAPARIALTGTPVENRLSELWSIMDWASPGLLGHLESFTRRVAVPVERHRDPVATARFAAMIRPFLLRRKKSDPNIAPELPPKIETDRIVPLTAEQVTLYEAVVRETMAAIEASEGLERAGLVFKLLTALKQICNHPAQYLKQPGPLAGRSGKLAAFDELTDVIMAEGEAMLVFTQYTQMGTLLQQHLDSRGIRSLFLHGRTAVRRREEMVEEFQRGPTPVFLLSLKAGGTGLTLTRATHVLHYDRWWNPAVEDQATDRAYRIGQDRTVQVHRLVAEGTLEDRIAELLESKRELADAVVGSGEQWITEMSNEELTELVSLRAAS